MFHGRQTIVYNDTVTSFENLLIKDKSFTIHHQNIQLLAIEIYKAIHNLPGGNLSEFFVRNNHNYNLRSESELLLPNVNTVFKGQNSISYFGSVIWNSIPFKLTKASSCQIFRSNCPCRLWKSYLEVANRNLGFINKSTYLVRYIVDCIFYLILDFIHCVDSVEIILIYH